MGDGGSESQEQSRRSPMKRVNNENLLSILLVCIISYPRSKTEMHAVHTTMLKIAGEEMKCRRSLLRVITPPMTIWPSNLYYLHHSRSLVSIRLEPPYIQDLCWSTQTRLDDQDGRETVHTQDSRQTGYPRLALIMGINPHNRLILRCYSPQFV